MSLRHVHRDVFSHYQNTYKRPFSVNKSFNLTPSLVQKKRTTPYEDMKAGKRDRDYEWVTILKRNLRNRKDAIHYVQKCYLRLQKMSDDQIVAFFKISEVGEDVQNCIKELQDMPLSKEEIASFTTILLDLEKTYQNVEKTIQETWNEANRTKFLKNLSDLYSNSNNDIRKQWRTALEKAVSDIIDMAEHIEKYTAYNYSEFNLCLWQPKVEPCNDGKSCKKCKAVPM